VNLTFRALSVEIAARSAKKMAAKKLSEKAPQNEKLRRNADIALENFSQTRNVFEAVQSCLLDMDNKAVFAIIKLSKTRAVAVPGETHQKRVNYSFYEVTELVRVAGNHVIGDTSSVVGFDEDAAAPIRMDSEVYATGRSTGKRRGIVSGVYALERGDFMKGQKV